MADVDARKADETHAKENLDRERDKADDEAKAAREEKAKVDEKAEKAEDEAKK